MPHRCRHANHSWLLAGGTIEWCYWCGAYRHMKQVSVNGVAPYTYWNKPTGADGPSPEPSKVLPRHRGKHGTHLHR
jgi:hypothetical protein